MQSDHILGIDVSKDKLVCSLVRTGDKERVWLDNFSNNHDGINRLLARVPAGSPIILEPTSWYGNALVAKASASGRTVFLAPGRQAKAFRCSIQTRAKTDPKDSFGLALFGLSRRLWEYRLKSKSVDELDQHLSYRKQLSRMIASLGLQARSMPYASDEIRPTITELKGRLTGLDKKIASLVKADPQFHMVGKLMAVPGFGPVTSAAVGSRLVHKQFTNAKQFVAYTGMDIGLIESGQRKGTTGITKDGDAELRRLLYVAAQASLRVKNSPFQTIYVRELAKGRHKIQAICTIARKMAKLAWSMVYYQTAYDPERIYKDRKGKQAQN